MCHWDIDSSCYKDVPPEWIFFFLLTFLLINEAMIWNSFCVCKQWFLAARSKEDRSRGILNCFKPRKLLQPEPQAMSLTSVQLHTIKQNKWDSIMFLQVGTFLCRHLISDKLLTAGSCNRWHQNHVTSARSRLVSADTKMILRGHGGREAFSVSMS